MTTPRIQWRRLTSASARRWALALILVGAVVFPGVTAKSGGASCRRDECEPREAVLWSAALTSTGSWVAEDGVEGTVPVAGQAYAAIGDGVAVIGVGTNVVGYDAQTGAILWAVGLSGVPAGYAIDSVRVWPGVVTAGVSPAASGVDNAGGIPGRLRGANGSVAPPPPSNTGPTAGEPPGEEFVLNSSTGAQIRVLPAVASGGAVSASTLRTVVIGSSAVTSYSNASGRVIWRDMTGHGSQAWRVSGSQLYITVSAQGEIGTAPVTAVRQVSLASGDERLIQSPDGAFDGTLVGAFDGDLIFAGSHGLNLYQEGTGRLISQLPGAVFQGYDQVAQVLYVDEAGGLVGIDPVTGQKEPGNIVPGPTGTYGVHDGVALGLDPGSGGEAWGYSIEKRRVIWTTRSLPWPHYFVNLTGLGGSADPGTGDVLLATCTQTGQSVAVSSVVGVSALACVRPRLEAIGSEPPGETKS